MSADFGAVVVETRGPRAHVVILGGVFLLCCGALGFIKPIAFVIAVPGLLLVVWGARKPVVRICERGVVSGSRRMAYERLRSVRDEQYTRAALDPNVAAKSGAGTALVSGVDAYITLSDGSATSVVRLQRSAEIEAALARHVLPAAVTSWRQKLEAGETYKVANSILEVKRDECWAPSPRPNVQPVLLPFHDTRIEGTYAYRDRPQPVAQHAALGHDLLLRSLLASYGVRVS